MDIKEVAAQAGKIFEAHAEGAHADAGFDAGEFSGPAHSEMEHKEVSALAEAHGFTFEDVMSELHQQDIAAGLYDEYITDPCPKPTD